MIKKFLHGNACAVALLAGSAMLYGQAHDPGVRGGPSGAGGPYPTLSADEKAFFNSAKAVFEEVDSVNGTLPGEDGRGLGPGFNANSCAMCHAFPAVGGTSPQVNPQVANNFGHLDGAANPVDLSGFLSLNGPIREVRFIRGSNGPDGGVHDIFTVAGRSDAPGCSAAQPNFPQQLASGNLVFRIPTPVFGGGLLENVPESSLVANLAANASTKTQAGIAGKLNRTGNDGTITRFGWKGQNKSLELFAGEAYNVEQGVTNEIFQNERDTTSNCQFNTTPEDRTGIGVNGAASGSDLIAFAGFMRLSAPPAPTTSSASELNGQRLFDIPANGGIGCALCHTVSLTTGQSPFTGMGNVTFHPYSDLAVHHMGSTLADAVSQGNAGGDEFRTAPLWGVGQRVFFLHDGRTSDLLQAIQAHSSPGGDCQKSASSSTTVSHTNGTSSFSSSTSFCGSEGSIVVSRFNALNASQQQDILNFLRSL